MELENFLSNEKGSEIEDIPSLVILWSKVTFSTYFILRTYELAFATNANVNKSIPSWQCDQMEKLFSSIWPFMIMKKCLMAKKLTK